MRQESDESDFCEIVLALLVGGIVFRYLRRRCGLDINEPLSTDTPEEKLFDVLGEINAGEMREGRAPFFLLRAPRRDTLKIIPANLL
jgi:hypothetical protein